MVRVSWFPGFCNSNLDPYDFSVVVGGAGSRGGRWKRGSRQPRVAHLIRGRGRGVQARPKAPERR